MVHIFHFLPTSLVFEIANPFSWIFNAISSDKSCLISTWRQDTRIFPAYWILIGQFKFPARQPYARRTGEAVGNRTRRAFFDQLSLIFDQLNVHSQSVIHVFFLVSCAWSCSILWDLLRHLSTKCRSILSADMLVSFAAVVWDVTQRVGRLRRRLPIWRPTLGGYIDRHYIGRLWVACRSTWTDKHVGRHPADTSPPLGRDSAATRPILYQHSANSKLAWSALATEFYLPCSTERGPQWTSSFFNL